MPALPLSALPPLSAAPWPAAAMALRLLESLGAPVGSGPTAAALSSSSGVSVTREPRTAAQDWALSGAMALTGYDSGSPLHSTGQPATLASAAAIVFELLTAAAGNRVEVDGAALLGERAALLGYHRQGHISAGGSARLLPTVDGWLALNLARPGDFDVVPALIEAAVVDEPWACLARWAGEQRATDAASRAQLLGLASAALPKPHRADPQPSTSAITHSPWAITALPCTVKPASGRLRVVNLGALWAAPLCAHLLSLAGADVIDVESTTRPDTSRTATPVFYDLLRTGHHRVLLDFGSEDGRAALAGLLRSADVVIEASRPRALENLGVPARLIMADRKRRIWVRITGHGSSDSHANLIGFGDDAAVAGGLIGIDPSTQSPVFAGDAIADPLTGLLAAVAVTACLSRGQSWLVDVSLRASAAAAVAAGPSTGAISASPPHAALRRTG